MSTKSQFKQTRPHRTVFAPETGEAPLYWECPVCGYISGDPSFMDGQHPCSVCGATDGDRREYPTERIRRLDARIRQYDRDGEHEIVVILVMALLEAVVEDILDRIMDAHGADLPLRRMVMDTQRSIGVRIGKLFPSLTGEEFEEAAAELGYRDSRTVGGSCARRATPSSTTHRTMGPSRCSSRAWPTTPWISWTSRTSSSCF